MKLVRSHFERLLRRGVPLSVVLTVAAGMAVQLPGAKIATWLIGSGLAGLLFALRLCLIPLPTSDAWKDFVVRSKTAQKKLNNSPYGIYRKIIFGSSIPDNGFEHITIEDTASNFIFIFACLGMGAALWLEPSVIDFQFRLGVEMLEATKASFIQFISVVLLSAGFSGVFLNVFRWFLKKQPGSITPLR